MLVDRPGDGLRSLGRARRRPGASCLLASTDGSLTLGYAVTLFEFVSVMVSIILGLSLAQALIGVSNLARESKWVRGFVPHTLWIVTLVLSHFLTWWAVWDYRPIDWTYARFLVVLSVPLTLFFLTSVIFPGRPDGSEVDLREYFFQVRRWFMLGWALLSTIWILDGPFVMASEPLWASYRVPQVIGVIVAVWGLRTVSPRAHRIIAVVGLTVILIGSVVRFLPGAFAPAG